MIICPICEHQQAQGIECDVCGKKLAVAAPVAVAVTVLPELEGTQLAGGRAPVAVAPVADLELTARAPVQVGAVTPVTDLDAGRSAAVGNVVVAPVQDLDTGRSEWVGAKTAKPSGPIVCRYCRTPQAEGLVCERCGMRLPKPREVTAAPSAEQALVATGEWTKCTKCQTNTRAGRACVSCGTHVPAAD